ncbi:MAG TPA: hypothetical protein VNM92_12035 [Thermoanaerobaculia bacterium]|nr:hypothetical protein [Thermoanaerobaculia bacterium]
MRRTGVWMMTFARSIYRGVTVVALMLTTLPVAAQEFSQAVVPVVSNVVGVGGVQWKCRVEIRNDFNYPLEIFVSLPAVEGTFYQQPLDPGQVVRFNDVVFELFGLRGIISPLMVQTTGRRSATVIATTYGLYNGSMTTPQYTPTVYGKGQHWVGMLRDLTVNKEYRTNIGMVNLSEQSAPFTAALQLVTGRNVAVAQLIVPSFASVQVSALTLFPLVSEADDFSIVVDSPVSEAYSYAVVIRNKTHDSRYVPPGAVLTMSRSDKTDGNLLAPASKKAERRQLVHLLDPD